MTSKQLPVMIQSLWLTQCHSARLISYLKRAKIVMAISCQTTWLNKSRMWLTFLKQRPMDLWQASFYLIMPRATKSEHRMLFLPEKCPSSWMKIGATTRMDQGCETWHLWHITHQWCSRSQSIKVCISLMTIHTCLAGSREWRFCFGNVVSTRIWDC